MKVFSGLLLSVLLFLVTGCASTPKVPDVMKRGETRDEVTQESVYGERYIQATEYGIADENLPKAQRKILARDAAIVRGERELMRMIKGLHLVSGETVEKAMVTDSRITETVNSFIKGREIIKTEYAEDGTCAVTLRIDKEKLKKYLDVGFEE
ncbi:hypothetical protein KJ693_11675 [bacterium]|nr:hypothetical protein [bacterium]MBU1615950.1 hypothetical protein [bacterium]